MLKTALDAAKLAKALKGIHSQDLGQKEKALGFINEILAQEQGLFAKFIQFLGSKENHELSGEVYAKSDPVPLGVVVKIFEETFHKKFESVFKEISDEPKMASIGQVHYGVLLDGTEVALKVQYPHIESQVKSQLRLFGLLPALGKVGPAKKWGIPVKEYQSFFSEMIEEELDYHKEVQHHHRFSKNLENESFLKTSEIIKDFTSPKIYLQTFIDGDSIDEVCKSWTSSEKETLSYLLFESFLKQVFVHRFFQGDTNHGNFLFSARGGEVNIHHIDFGSCYELSEDFTLTLIRLIYGVIEKDDINIMGCLLKLGFDVNKLSHIEHQLPQILIALFRPLTHDFAYSFKDWNLNDELEEVLGDLKWWFRSSGGMEFFSVMKAFSGYKELFYKLDSKLPFRRIFLNITKDLKDRAYEIHLPKTEKRISFDSMAKHVKIRVTEMGREKVSLTFPITVLDELEDLMESETKKKLKQRSIHIPSIVKETKKLGCKPCEIFELIEENKTFRVWIE